MKEIEPVVFPLNLGTAIILNCTGQDNFSTNVFIYYQLLSQDSQILQGGNLTMTGFDYEAYNTSNDGNSFLYQWVANELNVILV